MKALYFRHHALEQEDCLTVEEGKAKLGYISDDGQGWAVGIYDEKQKVLYLDGFDNIIGQDPVKVESRVLRDLKDAGIVPEKLEKLK